MSTPLHAASAAAPPMRGELAARPAAPRTVLMIAYAFPPEAYVGGRRTLKYCKYLGDFGWRPIVVTIEPRAHAFRDEALARQVPRDVVVHRTRDLDAVAWLETASAWWRRLRPRHAERQPSGPAAVPATDAPASAGWLRRAADGVARVLLECPDPHVWWVPLAAARGARVLLSRRVDVVYSSSPPHSSHLAGYLLARCFRVPHVVDLRDPWTVGGSGRGAMPGLFGRLHARVRRLVLRSATRIVVVSPGEPRALEDELGLDAGRVTAITNGYDPDDFPADDAPVDDAAVDDAPVDRRYVTLTHTGTIYGDTGVELFDALERVLACDPALREVLRVNLVGDVDAGHVAAVERLEAAGVVRRRGLLPHRQALAVGRGSDALVVLARGRTVSASHIPAKVFEYLFLEKPILAIAGPGSLSEMLRASGLGIVVPPRDVPCLAQAIHTLCRDVGSGRRARPDRVYITRFERRTLTGRFAGVLEEAARGV